MSPPIAANTRAAPPPPPDGTAPRPTPRLEDAIARSTPPPDGAPATREDTGAEPSSIEASATRPKRILRSGANKVVNDAFLALCDTYLGKGRPRTMQDIAKAVMGRYDGGALTAKQLADFISAFYEAIGDLQDASHEQAAWLSSMERKKDHWGKLGYKEYEDYLAAIDPHGKARAMIDMHRQTVRRKTNAIYAVEQCWAHSPELQELVSADEGEGKWMSLASLARATDRVPEVAKYCLNKVLLARLQRNTAGRRFFSAPDFIEARKMASTIDWTARPWDREDYERISHYSLKLYRGVLLPKTKYPGKEDTQRTRRIDLTQDAQQPATTSGPSINHQEPAPAPGPSIIHQEPATTSGPSPRQGLRLTRENLAAVDAGLGSGALHPQPAESVSGSSGLSSAPSRVSTPTCLRDTPPCEPMPTPCPQAAPTINSQRRAVPPPTPVSLFRDRIRAADHTAGSDSDQEHGSPTLTVARRRRMVQSSNSEGYSSNQVSIRSRFRITDPELPPSSSISLDSLLEEVTGGRSQEWISKEEIYLPRCFDLLLKDDQEVVEMLDYERKLIKHHGGKELWESPTSLAHQAARQDPGMFLLAAACLDNHLVVAVPFKGRVHSLWNWTLTIPQITCICALLADPAHPGAAVCHLPGLDFRTMDYALKILPSPLGGSMSLPTLKVLWTQLEAVSRFGAHAHWDRQCSANFHCLPQPSAKTLPP